MWALINCMELKVQPAVLQKVRFFYVFILMKSYEFHYYIVDNNSEKFKFLEIKHHHTVKICKKCLILSISFNTSKYSKSVTEKSK